MGNLEKPTVLVLTLSQAHKDPRVLRQIALLNDEFAVYTAALGDPPPGVAGHTRIDGDDNRWRSNYRAYYVLSLTRQFSRLYFGAPWVRAVREALGERSFDVVLANDVITIPLALALQPRGGVHADLHEYAPRQGEHNPTWRRYIRPIMTWILKKYGQQLASATTVSPGLAAEYQREFALTCEVVPNAANHREHISPRGVDRDGPIRLVHTGAAGRGRRIEDMIIAVATANQARPQSFIFDLYLQPGDHEYIRELRELTRAPGFGEINIYDPVPFDEIVPTLTGYDIGVFVCPPTTFNLRHALPNKIFEYVQARLAVLIGPSVDIEPYVTAYGIGFISRHFDAKSVADLLVSLEVEAINEAQRRSHAAAAELGAASLSQPWLNAVRELAR